MMDSHYFKTSDGINLHYAMAGTGETLLFLPGGGFSIDIFHKQFEFFSQHYQIIALDQRGHGKSDKPEYGYRVARLAKDLNELIHHLKLDKLWLIGHSLGGSVAYQYLDLFGQSQITGLVLIDEPALLLHDPGWSSETIEQLGAIYSPENLHEMLHYFIHDDSIAFKEKLIQQMTSPMADDDLKSFLLSCMTLPGQYAAKLYLNNICQDYRDILPLINCPSLFITGKASLHPWQSHLWLKQQVKNASLSVFNRDEGGSHFMFIENPEKFNHELFAFLKNA